MHCQLNNIPPKISISINRRPLKVVLKISEILICLSPNCSLCKTLKHNLLFERVKNVSANFAFIKNNKLLEKLL
jgi:hypothetical protein